MREFCIVCNDKIFRENSKFKRKRSVNSVTCNQDCSKEYLRNTDKYEQFKSQILNLNKMEV